MASPLVACFWLPQIGVLCERTRCSRLVGEPVVLCLGDTVAVVSEEAARFSVRPGVPVAGANSLCPGLHVLPYDAKFYEEAVCPIWDAVAVETSTVETTSAELCFGELDGTDLLERANLLVRQIASCLRTRVMAGLARTKLLAEQAAHGAGPAEVVQVSAEEEEAFLAPLRLTAVRQIDSSTGERLGRLGVLTVGELQQLSLTNLTRQFRDKGHWLYKIARGSDGDTVRALWPPPSIVETYSFDAFGDIDESQIDQRALEHVLSCCSKRIAWRLEEQHTRCGELTLACVLPDSCSIHEAERLKQPVHKHPELLSVARRLLDRLRLAKPPRELTLTASRLGTGSSVQLDLLSYAGLDHARRQQLSATVEGVQAKYGIGTVSEGVTMPERPAMLFTEALTHQRSVPVEVKTDATGIPRLVGRDTRRGIRDLCVARILDIWKVTRWFCGSPRQATVYRFEDEDGGFFDLLHLGFDEWQLAGDAD